MFPAPQFHKNNRMTTRSFPIIIGEHVAVNRRIYRKDRKKRMLEQQEIAPEEITFFDDMVLGKGGFATVQLAEYQQTTVAAKVVSMADVDAGEEAKEKVTKMFVCELHAMADLRSDYTVNLFGAVTTITEKLVLVMEFMEGKPHVDQSTFLRA